jgi:Flp pilus assembly protein TadD
MIRPGTAMTAAASPLDAQEIRQLVSIGFHGALNGRPEGALRLFEGLAGVRPTEGFPRIGSALALLAMGRANEAVRVLQDALIIRPDDEQIRVFLGMTLCVASRGTHARKVLRTLTESAVDTPVARLARRLFEYRPAGPLRRRPEGDLITQPNRGRP